MIKTKRGIPDPFFEIGVCHPIAVYVKLHQMKRIQLMDFVQYDIFTGNNRYNNIIRFLNDAANNVGENITIDTLYALANEYLNNSL